jgi:hypothetical protein
MQFITNNIRATCASLMSTCLALATGSAHAGASLLVDDAAVTPAGRCQVETWARAYSHGQELTAVPACNYAGTEFSLAVSDFFKPGTGPLLNLGAKHLWRDFGQASFGIGTSVGATWNADNERVEILSFSIPASIALDTQRNLVLHANLGWLDTRGIGQGLNGGVGIERVVTAASVLLAEFYVQYDQVRIGQLGLRHAVNDSTNIDVLVGHQDHVANGSTFVTLGFNILLH